MAIEDINDIINGKEYADTEYRASKVDLVDGAESNGITPAQEFKNRMTKIGANIVSMGYLAPRRTVGRRAVELCTRQQL